MSVVSREGCPIVAVDQRFNTKKRDVTEMISRELNVPCCSQSFTGRTTTEDKCSRRSVSHRNRGLDHDTELLSGVLGGSTNCFDSRSTVCRTRGRLVLRFTTRRSYVVVNHYSGLVLQGTNVPDLSVFLRTSIGLHARRVRGLNLGKGRSPEGCLAGVSGLHRACFGACAGRRLNACRSCSLYLSAKALKCSGYVRVVASLTGRRKLGLGRR